MFDGLVAADDPTMWFVIAFSMLFIFALILVRRKPDGS